MSIEGVGKELRDGKLKLKKAYVAAVFAGTSYLLINITVKADLRWVVYKKSKQGLVRMLRLEESRGGTTSGEGYILGENGQWKN